MIEPRQPTHTEDRYRKLLAVLEANQKYLQSLNLEDDLLGAYKELLRYLRSRSPDAAAEILGLAREPHRQPKVAPPRFRDEEIRAMNAAQVKSIAADPSVSRKELEQVAMIRFGVTKGGLSNLRSRGALVEKLLTLIGHESTHESISRVVEGTKPVRREPDAP